MLVIVNPEYRFALLTRDRFRFYNSVLQLVLRVRSDKEFDFEEAVRENGWVLDKDIGAVICFSESDVFEIEKMNDFVLPVNLELLTSGGEGF